MKAAIGKVPADAWTPAYHGDREVRSGAWVTNITGMLGPGEWPAGMRVIVRKERPHPGAQLRFTDIDGHRFTAASSLTWNSVTGAGRGARTGFAAPRTPGCVTCPCTATLRTRSGARSSRLACELLAWMQMLALAGPARRWEPKRLRLRIFSCAGRIVRGSRRLKLRLAAS